MTTLERQMAADAIALSKEHADRADAAEARAKAAEARLAEVRELARSWADSAAPNEWSETLLSTTVLADAGRAILAVISTDEAPT